MDNNNIDILHSLIATHYRALDLDEKELANLIERAINEASRVTGVRVFHKGANNGGFYVGNG
jgi:hypothetical protein